jgi:MFS family permease
MRRIHMPVLLRNVPKASAASFVVLFTLEGFCRGVLMTVVPLTALDLLGGARQVSLLYLATSATGLVATLLVPVVVHALRRRWVLTIGAALYFTASLLYITGETWALVVALGLFVSGTAVIDTTLNMYVLDHIPRRSLAQFEPKRMFFGALTFSIGPWIGVQLHYNVAHNLAFVVAAAAALALAGYFWYLRLTEDPAVMTRLKPPPNPIRYLKRFFSQPRLVLAWVLALGRNGWWIMFVIYTPIHVTQSGYSPETGGLAVSIGILPMLLMPLWAKVSARWGIRPLLITGYTLAGLLSISAWAASAIDPLLSIVLLCCSAFGATMVDGAGNVPFLRAVHPYERAEMTSVFMTFRHGSNLAAPGFFAGVLTWFALPVVFLLGGTGLLAMAGLARFIPRRM